LLCLFFQCMYVYTTLLFPVFVTLLFVWVLFWFFASIVVEAQGLACFVTWIILPAPCTFFQPPFFSYFSGRAVILPPMPLEQLELQVSTTMLVCSLRLNLAILFPWAALKPWSSCLCLPSVSHCALLYLLFFMGLQIQL
jgi:hypothetical protein